MILILCWLLLFSSLVHGKGTLIVYWGQDSAGVSHPTNLEKSLGEVCMRPGYDIVIIGFLISFNDSRQSGQPDLNLSNHCETAFPNYPFLLNCPTIGNDIQNCQKAGKKILLSLGGAAGSYYFPNDAAAKSFASTIWGMFLGNTTAGLLRTFGSAVLDGIDLDIEGGSPQSYGIFISTLRTLMNFDKSRRYLITAAPQCPQPDAFLGPSPSTALGQSPSSFDYVNVQFYNNFCGYSGGLAALTTSYKQWANWANSVPAPRPKIVLGLPSSTFASNSAASFISTATLPSVLSAINSSNAEAFGGVMLWDASWDQINVVDGATYGSAVAKLITNIGV